MGLLEEPCLDEPERSQQRRWTPLQMKNPEYLITLKNRENERRDFIMENIVSIDILRLQASLSPFSFTYFQQSDQIGRRSFVCLDENKRRKLERLVEV